MDVVILVLFSNIAQEPTIFRETWLLLLLDTSGRCKAVGIVAYHYRQTDRRSDIKRIQTDIYEYYKSIFVRKIKPPETVNYKPHQNIDKNLPSIYTTFYVLKVLIILISPKTVFLCKIFRKSTTIFATVFTNNKSGIWDGQ